MKYSVSIPLGGNALSIAKKTQKILSESLRIESILKNNSPPHINLVSGTTKNIEKIISAIQKLNFNNDKYTELIGLGVLLTPNPLLYLRFKNSAFFREIRYRIIKKTLHLWESIDQTALDDIWIPKSTLAYNDLSLINLSDALINLKHINFKALMEVEELKIIDFTEKEIIIDKIIL